ncbi:MAG: hypothetical protein IJR90_06440 [Clostridia bacterium]|nr:hypothetical protein [Clostridia bacterium]
MAETFIRTEGLCFSYKDDEGRPIPILHDINIDIKRGEFLCILGRTFRKDPARDALKIPPFTSPSSATRLRRGWIFPIR